MVSSLVSKNQMALNRDAPGQISLPESTSYEHQQFCQIWSFSGGLVGRSDGAPSEQLVPASATGFRNVTQGGKALRVYTIVDRNIGGQVTVGDSLELRDRLVRDVIAGFLWPALVILPIMWALIWLSIARGLAPLDRFARDLATRQVSDLGALPDTDRRPREIRPVASALNDLLARLGIARDRERDFISYAAHELKTPLAGLKTQAHIARRAPDAKTRDHALSAIETSVGRTDRMVHQLLDLARVESRKERGEPVNLIAILQQVLSALAEFADHKGVPLEFEETAISPALLADPFLLTIALRNLIENAIQASPTGETVAVTLAATGPDLSIDIRDKGPGLPPEIATQAHQKFIKGSDSDQTGSGLGLSIATDAIEALGGVIRFERRADGHHTIIVLSKGNAILRPA